MPPVHGAPFRRYASAAIPRMAPDAVVFGSVLSFEMIVYGALVWVFQPPMAANGKRRGQALAMPSLLLTEQEGVETQ